MPRKSKLILAISILLLVGVAAGWMENKRLIAQKQQRERHMVVVYYLALMSDSKHPRTYATNLDGTVQEFGAAVSALLKPFPDSPVYHGSGKTFTLEEPRPRRVSLFHSDRLIATESKWPRWEYSGEYARKFPEQEIPEELR